MKHPPGARLILKAGKEKSVVRGHPWIFSGAVERIEGDPGSGETVRVLDAGGVTRGWAAYSPQSQIRARLWSTDPEAVIDTRFFERRLEAALARRPPVGADGAQRLVHGEVDGLPGLIVDRYADVLVGQFLAAGPETHKRLVADVLLRLTGARALYERSDAEVRELEGLAPATGWLHGPQGPQAPQGPRGLQGPTLVPIVEDGLSYEVDIAAGQKTGFYLDQRPNRMRVREEAAGQVLNCFCYTGGFTVAALAGGAEHVLSVDSSGPALAAARRHVAANGFAPASASFVEGDVFQVLRELRNAGRRFHRIILDPPKFAPTAAHAANAARAYKDINLLGLKLLAPGGRLYTFSCSAGISAEFFQTVLAQAAADAGVAVRLEERMMAGPDHPVALHFPEGEYLKGLVLACEEETFARPLPRERTASRPKARVRERA